MVAPSPQSLVAVVVTHDRLEQLRVTLARLCDCRPEDLARIVVVDNASTDGTADWLARQTDPRIEVLRLDTNRGGAGGFAAGLETETARAADWTVLMDDDGRPEMGALAAFHALPKEGWDAIAAAVRLPDGRIAEMNRPSRNPFWARGGKWAALRRGRNGYHVPPAAYDQGAGTAPLDMASFVGFFLSRAALLRHGGPDPALFLYADDALYSLRLRQAGGRIGFAPAVRFEHDCGTFAAGGRMTPVWKLYFYHRNLLILYRAAAGRWFWPAMLIVLPRWAWGVRAYGVDRPLAARLLRRAIRDGLAGRTDADPAEIIRQTGAPRRP